LRGDGCDQHWVASQAVRVSGNFYLWVRKARQTRVLLIANSLQRQTFELFGPRTPKRLRPNPGKLPFSGDLLWRPKNKSTARWTGQCAAVSMPQMNDEAIDEISRIEAQLKGLVEVSERCRKIALVSKAAIAGGIALPIFMMLGLFQSNGVAAIGSIAVILGGIVSLGSNASTLQQTMAAMNVAEALRSDLIDRIDLRVVGERNEP